ncbi:MAG: 16S rRNA processing protein RimM [Flavobacteriaceae bacterium]|nr:16S rRNA processing protein RimM [Flavobacteriaceae bacterium]
MQKKDCFYLGRIVKKYSFKGEVVLKLDTDEPDIYENLNAVFLDLGKNLLPFFIKSSLLQKGNQLRIQFEDVNNETDADAILKTDVYLPLNLLPKLTGDQFYFHEVIGFMLEDINYGEIGIITSINDKTAQDLFVIEKEDTEILIPMIDEFIKKIDRKNKKVIIETPEGLIDMNE